MAHVLGLTTVDILDDVAVLQVEYVRFRRLDHEQALVRAKVTTEALVELDKFEIAEARVCERRRKFHLEAFDQFGGNRRLGDVNLLGTALGSPDKGIIGHDARFDLDRTRFAVAQVSDLQDVAFLDPLHKVQQLHVGGLATVSSQGFVIHRRYDVARTQAGVTRRATRGHAEDRDAVDRAGLVARLDRHP